MTKLKRKIRAVKPLRRRKLKTHKAGQPTERRSDAIWHGSTDPDILFVVDPMVGRPGNAEPPNAKHPIGSKHLEFLEQHCKDFGVPLARAAITRACSPVTAEVWGSDKRTGDHIKSEHEIFYDNVIKAKPKLIIPMGKAAARQVFNRAVKIMNLRGTPQANKEYDCTVFPMLGIGHVMRVMEVRNLFNSDFATLAKIVENDYALDYQDDRKADYSWCTDLSPLLKRADAGEKLLLSTDIEGLGLRWYEPTTKILTVQLTWEAGQGIAVPIDYNHEDQSEPHDKAPPPPKHQRMKLVAQLKRLLEHPNVAVFGQNFKFDYIMLEQLLGIRCRNWLDDTICLMHAVDENLKSKSLDDGARIWVPEMAGYADEFNRDPIHEKKSRMDKVGPDKMLAYGCGDTDATFRLRKNLLEELRKDKRAYGCYRKVVMPALRAFAEIEHHGFTVSKKELKKFEKFLRAYQKEQYEEILEMIPDSIREEELGEKYQKRVRGTDQRLPASLTRPGFLRAMLFDHPDGLELEPRVFTKSTRNNLDESTRVPSTSAKEHLAYFEDEHPFVSKIMEYTKNEKLLGTYVGTEDGDTIKGFYKYIFEGRIRPTYLLHRTVTGRTASADPNGQNFPKRGKLAKQYRKVFRAPKGYCYLEVDFSQLELRVAAILANDPTMLDLYRRGADIHAATAAAVMGITLDEFNQLDADTRSHKRFQAKAVNFGFLYGMGWRKFITYAKTEYGIEFTEDEAQQIQRAFFSLYSALKPWHNATRDYVRRTGFVRSLDGRVRHLPNVHSDDEALASSAERMAINSPVQGFGSDLGLIAMRRLVDAVDFDLVRPIGFIHDALVCLAPLDRAKEAAAVVKNIMETLPLRKMFGIELPIPIIAEAEVGLNLAEMIEIGDDVFADDNVSTFRDIQLRDWEARCRKAEERGEELPPKPAAPAMLRRRPLKRLRKRTGSTPLRRVSKPSNIRLKRKLTRSKHGNSSPKKKTLRKAR